MSRQHAYTEKERAYVREQRRLQRNRYREQVGLPIDEIKSETELRANARAYRLAEQREEMTLRRWLVRYGHVLWSDPTTTRPASVVAVPEEALSDQVQMLNPSDYSWLSGSCS